MYRLLKMMVLLAMAGFMTGGDDGDTGANTEGTCATGGDDEDGIVFATPLIPGYQACVSVTATTALVPMQCFRHGLTLTVTEALMLLKK
ncbi:MAG: hypothetical protein R2784_17195 [Saprospiraceae bacterium]